MKTLIALAFACAAAFAQQEVRISPSSPSLGYSYINYYSSTNLIYSCKAPSYINPVVAAQEITVSAASNANPVSFTATAHGLGDYATNGATVTPTVIISGGTGNWAAINGVWVATTTSANAFTIPVNSTTFGALTGTLTVTTTSPRWTKNVWSITKFSYDSSNNLIAISYPSLPGGVSSTTPVGGSTAYAFICANRASLSWQ